MKKIAIVGVDGSGKTVLMTALGDKYENPDEFGLFLSPESSDAFGYVKLQMDRMRHGMWPSATIAGKSSILEWGLYRKVNGDNARLCDLSFLDFSGEVYRMAFGSTSDHDAAQYEDEEIARSIDELRQHIKEADTLAVLVNLKDIISGNIANPRTREAMWLSKSIIDYAARELHTPNISMVFTQADAYRATIDACGGIRGAYEKFLPHVANIYPDMKLLAVSSVNKTSSDENGIPCPVDGFQSEGLEELMEWIVSTVPGCETLISDIKTAPVRCREAAWALRDEYIVALSDGAKRRREILDRIEGKLVEMDSAMRAYPQALPQGALDILRDELQDIRNFEIAYGQLYGDVPSMSDEQISQGVEELCLGSSFAGKVRHKVNEALFAVRENAIAAAARKRRRTRWAIVTSILVLGAIAAGAYFVHAKLERERIAELRRQEAERQREERALVAEEEASKSKIARGWSYEMRKGHKIAVWKPGALHPWTINLRAAQQVDQWISTRPGYVWTTGTNLVWKAGEPYPGNSHCISSSDVDNWRADEGYRWAKPNDKDNMDVVWDPLWRSKDGQRRASPQEGVFEHRVDCSSCSGTGKRQGKRTCWNCNGSKKVSSSSTCARCDGSGNIDETSKCWKCNGSGVYERSCPDCGEVRDGWGNIVSYHGQVCDNCGGSGQVIYRGNGGLGDSFFIAGMQLQGRQPTVQCNKCGGRGWFHHSTCGQSGKLRETCSRCNGTGETSSSTKCWKCDGSGRVSESGRCSHCDSNGQVDGSVDCSNCNGTGKVWQRM